MTNIKIMVLGLRTCVLCLQPPLGQSTVHHPRRTASSCGSKVKPPGANEGRERSHRCEGGSWWVTNAPLSDKCLILPEVAFPRSVQRKPGNENKITRANMQMKPNQRKTPPHSRRSNRGNPRPPVASRPARIEDSLTARKERARKQTFWGPSPRPASLTLSPNCPPRETSQKNVSRRAWGREVGPGRYEGLGEHSCPGKQEEGESLSFEPPETWEMTSPADYVQLPRQESLAWATERQLHPALPSPPHSLRPGSPPEGERRPCVASREHDSPTTLRLCLRWGRGGPARGGVGETIGNAGKGGERQEREGRGLLTYSRFSCPF